MNPKQLIQLTEVCRHYEIEISFFEQIEHYGLLQIKKIENQKYVHQEQISEFEKILRLYQDLEINMEGIDVIFNLIEKINRLEEELNQTKSKLNLYEDL